MKFTAEMPERKSKKSIPLAATIAAGGVEVDAIICKIMTMADGVSRMVIDLPEMQTATFALLYELRNKSIKILIK